MSQGETPSPQETRPSDWIANLGKYRQQLFIGLAAAAILFALIPAYFVYKYQWEYAPVAVWGALLALIALMAALWLRLAGPGELFQSGGSVDLSGMEDTRGVLLLVGGSAGFATWVLSVALAFQWRATILGGLEAWQGEKWWQLWVCLLAMFGGLAIMLVSLLPARVVSHANVTLRRLVYGYNTVLTGLLVLAILLVLNVLVYNYFTASFDWTESRMYSLSDKSKNILQNLEKPTKIFAMVSRGDYLMRREIQTLLDNCRGVNDKIAVKYLSPTLDADEINDLMRRYQVTDPQGLLVLYGTDPQVEHQFIKYDDIIGTDPDARTSGKARLFFKGEDALMTALNSLLEGKTQSTVYFIQGHGELDINDSFGSEPDKGAGALRERLEKSNYQIKGLRFSPLAEDKPQLGAGAQIVVSNRVPDDAAVVVVVGPRRPLPPEALEALRNYMEPKDPGGKKGKLFILLDVVLDAGNNLVETGLENFVAMPYNVRVGNDRILRLVNQGGGIAVTGQIIVSPNPALRGRNPIATAFDGVGFLLADARTVTSNPGNPAGPASYSADNLLTTDGRGLWAEDNLRTPIQQLAQVLVNDRQLLAKKLAREDLPVAVAVSENVQAAPSTDPHAFMRQPTDQKPRMVVFGDASFACNRSIGGPRGEFELFSGTLAWLGEKPASIGLEPKKRNIFVINLTDDNFNRMHFMPAVMILVGIVGLGTGVWIVRRR